jgi:hypothetical protein
MAYPCLVFSFFSLIRWFPLCGAFFFGAVGTPWCDGLPTFWITGHQTCFESPRCLVNGTWIRNNRTMLDASDALNGGPIDRHYCVTMDVNRDNRSDIICGVGAVLGTGDGYTELYLTQPDGSVQKMLVCACVTFVMWSERGGHRA